MKQKLPDRLGGEFWFSLSMTLFALIGMFFAVRMKSGFNVFGSLVVTAAFIRRAYDRVRKVRLARFLQNNPEMDRIYRSWSGD